MRPLAFGLRMIYEDKDFLVVDKPAGLLSIARAGGREKSVYRALAEYLQKKGEKRVPAVVHRLDRETSGVMLLVKNARLKQVFMEQWHRLVLARKYVAVVEGVMPSREGVIDAPLEENRVGVVYVNKEGKAALTRWRVLESRPRQTVVEAELETGRHNQIRVHFAHIGHPVVGDTKYGPGKFGEKDGGHQGFSRLCLHAETLAFCRPGDPRVLEFSSPSPWTREGSR